MEKKKKTDAPGATKSDALPSAATKICHAKYANLDLRHAILDWRDKHLENVELHLTRELPSLYSALDEQTDKMSIIDIFKQKEYGKEHLEPIYREWVEREVTHLVNVAQKDLSTVFASALEFAGQGAAMDYEESSGHYTDAAIAVLATGIGLAAIPEVAAISVVTAGGILGVFGATTVVWPVLAIGAAAIGGLLVLGGYKATALKSSAISRYRIAVRKAIEQAVLGRCSEKDSICERLQSYIGNTAEKILLEIDQC